MRYDCASVLYGTDSRVNFGLFTPPGAISLFRDDKVLLIPEKVVAPWPGGRPKEDGIPQRNSWPSVGMDAWGSLVGDLLLLGSRTSATAAAAVAAAADVDANDDVDHFFPLTSGLF